MIPNQSENGKDNLIPGLFNKISKKFLCVYAVEVYHVFPALSVRVAKDSFEMQFDPHLFLQTAASVISRNTTRDLFQSITVDAGKNK